MLNLSFEGKSSGLVLGESQNPPVEPGALGLCHARDFGVMGRSCSWS